MMRKLSVLLLLVLLVGVFPAPTDSYARIAGRAINHIGYDDYLYTGSVNLRSPFRSGGVDSEQYSITEKYNQPRLWTDDTHEGVDFGSPHGTSVYAVYRGKIVYKQYNTSDMSNNRIILQLDVNNNNSESDYSWDDNVYAVYMHMSELTTLDTGRVLNATDIIGKTGTYVDSSGNRSPHLHFGLTKNWSSNYADLKWTPHYNYYKYSSLYNSAKHYDFIYNYIPPANGNGTLYISGYHKPDAYSSGNTLESMTLYHRVLGSGGSWQATTMGYVGSYQYTANLHSLGYSAGTQIEYLFVGLAYPLSSGNNSHRWGYYPGTYYTPPQSPNSYFPGTSTLGTYSNSLKYMIPLNDPDPYEPNNTMATARSISVGSYYYPYIFSPSDVDYFSFAGFSGAAVTINMSSIPSGTDYELQLLNSSGTVLKSSTLGGNSDETITETLPYTGTFYVKVWGYNSTYHPSDSYQLIVTSNGGGADNYEPNNTMSTATSISTGTNYYATIHNSSDIDYYKIYAFGGTLNIGMSSIPAGTDYDIALYNSSGTELTKSTASGNNNESIIYNVFVADWYYLKVYPWSGSDASDTYILRVN
ncbi:MAG: C-terminal target protein [Paenibacillaceae bacterium]|jgi:murein DD-endopeptidase MepM/ murein hydrolase activator NlpD|nr:C-terminal target protein [Paenibacillaceae bacterium]